MKKKKRLTQRDFGKVLVNNVMHTFEYAFVRALAGDQIEAMMIEHDILAANSLQRKEVTQCQRTAIKSAVEAVKQHIPYQLACSYMRERLEAKVEELLNELDSDKDRRRTKRH